MTIKAVFRVTQEDMRSSSHDLERDEGQAYFLRGLPITTGDLRRTLRTSDASMRAHWIAHVLREARYEDVWKFVTPGDIREDYPRIRRHLGRARPFWDFLIGRWQSEARSASV